MSFRLYTPEASVARSNSKNSAARCRGRTQTGAPCRRTLAFLSESQRRASPSSSSSSPSPAHPAGGVAVVPKQRHEESLDDVRFYCHQHKDQAQHMLVKTENARLVPLSKRNSLDSLMHRLGVKDVDLRDAETTDHHQPPRNPSHDASSKVRPLTSRSSTPRPRISERNAASRPPPQSSREKTRGASHRPKQPSLLTQLCCLTIADDDQEDFTEIIKHRKRVANAARPTESSRKHHYSSSSANGTSEWKEARDGAARERTERSARHINKGHEPSRMENDSPLPRASQPVQSLIPSTLSNQIKARLRNELSKPISVSDEPGFIYVYWLKDHDSAVMDGPLIDEVYSTKPSPAGNSPQSAGRRLHGAERPARKILVKIGRSKNVHSRLIKWSQQCGYEPSLLRVYPYLRPSGGGGGGGGDGSLAPTAPLQGSHGSVRMAPFSHRVESLVHIELADCQVAQDQCAVCGSKHREWFQVEATRDGLRRLDGIIRKWTAWADSKAAEN